MAFKLKCSEVVLLPCAKVKMNGCFTDEEGFTGEVNHSWTPLLRFIPNISCFSSVLVAEVTKTKAVGNAVGRLRLCNNQKRA